MSGPSGAGHREQIAVPVNSVPVSNPAAASPAAGRNTQSNAGEPLSVPQQPQRASDPVQAPARRPQKRPDQNSQQRGARTAAASKPATQSGATPADPATAPATPSSAGAPAAAAPSSPGASFGQTLAASLSGTTRKAGQTTAPGAKSKLTGTGQVDPQALAAAAALLRQLPTDASAPTEPTSTSTAAAPSATSPAGAPAADANALAAATALLGQTSALGNANSELTPSASQDARPPTAAATLAKTDPAVQASGDPATPPVPIAPLVAAAQTNAAHPAGADAIPGAAALTYGLSAQTIAADAAATPNSAPPADSAGSATGLVALTDHANAAQLLDVLTANASGSKSDPLAVTDPSAGAAPDATDPGSPSSAADVPFGAAAQSASATHTQSGAVEGPPLRSQIGTSAWTDELGARLTLMAHQGLTSASLRLTPDHLGPVEVKISVRDSSASVWFGASQADTRAALEQALPRLRELFAAQGLNLTNAGVSGESPRGAPHSPRTTVAPGDAAREAAVISVTSATAAHQGLIDTYA